MRKVITTVGTSIFLNNEIGNATLSSLEDLKDKSPANESRFKTEISSIKNALTPLINGNPKASAEIESLIQIKDHYGEDIDVQFICSDTLLSKLAADLITDNFSHPGIKIEKSHIIEDLVVNDSVKFQESGLGKLMEKLLDLVSSKSGKDIGMECSLNITGGYKGVIPFLTLFGQMQRLDMFYTYEDTGHLIRIPQLPVNFDASIAEKYYESMIDPVIRDDEMISEMYKLGLLDKKLVEGGKPKFKTSGLGKLFMDMIFKRAPESKSIFGYVVEYKLYEYFWENLPKGFNYVEHSSNILATLGKPLGQGDETDVLISDNRSNPGKFILVEVKSLTKFTRSHEETMKQISGKINTSVAKGIYPVELQLIFYTSNRNVYNAEIKDTIRRHLKIINEKVKLVSPSTLMRFFLIYANLQPISKRKNPYVKFMQSKIDSSTLKEIKIN